MTRLTRDLIRKKAEHHDGILADLEEISLHQLELEKLEAIGWSRTSCTFASLHGRWLLAQESFVASCKSYTCKTTSSQRLKTFSFVKISATLIWH
jgi:hypothetical protein